MYTNIFAFVLFGVCFGEEIESNSVQYSEITGYSLRDIEQEFREQDKDTRRPCPTYDLLCIRQYLVHHSGCKPTEGPVPDPLYRTQSNLYIPNFNLSVTQNELSITGLNGIVTEFKVYKRTALTVLTIQFKDVLLRSKRMTLRYHRRGQEPIITSTTKDDNFFPSFSTTTVFRGIVDLDLANSETVGFIDVPPVLVIGPEAGESTDPSTTARFKEVLLPSNARVVIPEAFLTEAPYFAAQFIQYVLCDFGLFLN